MKCSKMQNKFGYNLNKISYLDSYKNTYFRMINFRAITMIKFILPNLKKKLYYII